MKTFSQILSDERDKNKKPQLLLGAGFGEGYEDGYNYEKLTKNVIEKLMKDIDNEEGLMEYCKKEDAEFELIRKIIKSSKDKLKGLKLEDILLLLNNGGSSYKKLHDILCEKDGQKFNEDSFEKCKLILIRIFIKIFIEMHPKYSENKVERCSKRIELFHRIFSLNFDFLLYWCFLKANENQGVDFRDGFWKRTDEIKNFKVNKFSIQSPGYSIHYLHGALFVIQCANDIFKICLPEDVFFDDATKSGNLISEIEKVYKYFRNNDDDSEHKEVKPLIVFEGGTLAKETMIFESLYLSKMYDRLDKVETSLIIYGCSFSAHDHHIWRRVFKENRDRFIYIGIYLNSEDEKSNGKWDMEVSRIKNILIQKEHVDKKSFLIGNKEVKIHVEFFKITDKDNIWTEYTN